MRRPKHRITLEFSEQPTQIDWQSIIKKVQKHDPLVDINTITSIKSDVDTVTGNEVVIFGYDRIEDVK